MRKLSVAFAVSLGGLALFAPTLAQAHFMLTAPTSWYTQASDGSPQKSAPCGNEGATGQMASKVVTSVGQTVSVTVTATVAHPGWYRISLKQGASSTQTATGFPDPATLGAAGSAQQCTPAFMDNPVWSTTQPVLADKLGLPAGSTSTTTTQSGTKTFMVTIPSNASCTAAAPCTLQVVMFMTDHSAGSCNYHHCADITVGATGAGGAGGSGAGGTGGSGAGGRGGNGAGGRGGNGGSTTGAGGRGGTTGSGGTTGAGGTTGSAGTSGAAGNTGTQGSAGNMGSTGSAGTTGGSNDSGGCSYAVGEKSGGTVGIGAFVALAAFLVRRRRRR